MPVIASFDWFVSMLQLEAPVYSIHPSMPSQSARPSRPSRLPPFAHLPLFNSSRSMEDVIVVLAGTVEAAAEAAVARKTCSRCNTEQNIDQFLHARGNGRIVVNCLSCRHKSKLHVIILVTILLSPANLSQVEASRASTEISRAIARGDDSPLAFAPALAPGPRRNLTHGVLAAMYHERGRVFTDTPETAAARDQRLTIQRRHRVERRHGVQPSQTPTLSSLIGREQQLNAEDEALTTSRGDLLPVQAAEGDDLGGNVDDLRHTPPRRGRLPNAVLRLRLRLGLAGALADALG
ncbi:hypothetical protein F5144DRAFT_16204 [Chaetomium tenue]|uniref:Uncharacterized protein n=1 Tax=Chaetomium tenue TaxID=1854479 RepID=A0ACB7PLL6_9PEZI|nr:hypothetical protein F5144DRAFT_16204 [Chaetomium globosum]